MTTSSTSNAYGLAQSVLFCLFAAAVFFVRGPLLFVSEVAPIAGNVLSAAGLVFMLLAIAALRKVIQVAPEPRA
ncbi:MAG: hypothetical protein ACRENN_02230, partial [Candidatus Eiseniibacteriota bacterium]